MSRKGFGTPNGSRLSCGALLKLRRAEERLIPQSTRAVSFKRLLGGAYQGRSSVIVPKSTGFEPGKKVTESPDQPRSGRWNSIRTTGLHP